MKAVQPYLNFDGKTREAMTFYHAALGGELQIQTFADAKIPTPPGSEDRVVHARITVGSAILMASDSQPGTGVTMGNNVHINLECDSKEEVDRLFKALGEGGTVTMPAQDMFWGAYFGMLTDKFGVHWMFNASKN
jgi:PhnB protein